ncbi:MAG: hypothetical protein K6F93_06150 [Lachnospiraceae bacterium]|nr:hypothetical protein [Lachnospiraceae bacterium]
MTTVRIYGDAFDWEVVMGNVLTKEEILKILDQYKIGRKPLAKLLGWGETTVMQYINCENIPDNEYTKKLKRLLDDPGYYRELLVEGKDNITPIAYRKSLEAVDTCFKESKILICALWARECMNEKMAEVGRQEIRCACESGLLRLETVLLWSQIFSLRLLGYPLFEDDFQPGKNGLPFKVPEENYIKLVTLPTSLADSLSPEAKAIISKVNEVIMWYGPTALATLMKAENYRLCGSPGARRRRVVKTDTLKRAYGEAFDQTGVKRLKDIETYLQKRIAFVKKNPPQ